LQAGEQDEGGQRLHQGDDLLSRTVARVERGPR
jgi:hypothetical protein